MRTSIGLNRDKSFWIGAMLAPSAAVLAVQFLGGWSGPAVSNAQPLPTPTPPPSQSAPPAPAPAQAAAIEYLRSHALPTVIASPMREPTPRPETAPDPEPSPPKPEPAVPAGVPDIQVTAIVQSARGSVAAVGHRLMRIGDEIAEGWLITAIDASERIVRVRHTDGRTAEYTTFSPRSTAP